MLTVPLQPPLEGVHQPRLSRPSKRKGTVLMELILAGLAGLAGLALLLQSKSLPSEEDFKKAQGKLGANPLDPDANTTVGKYVAFVLGDYSNAMPYLVHSKDTTLKTLAEHELDATYTATPPQKVGMGDEWVAAAKKSPALSRIFYDRASQWYILGWPDLDPVWKGKLREQGAKLSASRPPGPARRGVPSGWKIEGGSPSSDGTVARSGSYSIKMPSDPKQEVFFKSDVIQLVPNNKIEYSGFVRSDGTDNKTDQIILNFFDKDGRLVGVAGVPIPIDVPFWNYVSGKADVPPEAIFVKLGAAVRSKKGTLWVDDVSLKLDGKESVKNASFEDK